MGRTTSNVVLVAHQTDASRNASSTSSSSSAAPCHLTHVSTWEQLENVEVLLKFLNLADSALQVVPMNVAKRYLTEIGCDSTGKPTDPLLKAARFRDQVFGLVLGGGATWFNDWCNNSRLRKPKTRDRACGYAHCGVVPVRGPDLEKNSTVVYEDAGNRVYSLVFHAVNHMQKTMQTLAKENNLDEEGSLWCGSSDDWALSYNEETAGDVV